VCEQVDAEDEEAAGHGDGTQQHHLLETGGVGATLVEPQAAGDDQVDQRGPETDRGNLVPRNAVGLALEAQPGETEIAEDPRGCIEPDRQRCAMPPEQGHEGCHEDLF
jgi:hypothetical protein